jgi:hypothetical protein
MAIINWISPSSSVFSNPLAWEGGVVPGAGDIAKFSNPGIGNCTLDAVTEIGGLDFTGGTYSGTFATANYNMTLGSAGFIAPTALAGVINLGTSTVTNSGNVDWRGLTTTTQFVTAQARWIQRGGTSQTRNTWKQQRAEIYKFQHMTFDPESHTEINAYLTSETDINGQLYIVEADLYFRGGTVKRIGSTGGIQGAWYINVYSLALEGYLENIRLDSGKVLLIQGPTTTFRNISGSQSLSVVVQFQVAEGANATVNIESPVRFLSDIILRHLGTTSKLTLYIPDRISVSGDIILNNAANAPIVIIGTVAFEGTNNQTVSLGSSSANIIVNKPSAGNLTVNSGNLTLAADSVVPQIINSAAIEVPVLRTLAAKYKAIGAARLSGPGKLITSEVIRALA